ncbi:MAG: HAD family hydrolase [Candidatus Aenigmarchaeota archaeon]|nr:HAD family hydrolase [Candidatus Aenigmarchaeota archaeon]
MTRMIKAIIFDADGTLYKTRTADAYKKQFEFLEEKTGKKSEKIEARWKKVKDNVLKYDAKNPEKRKREFITTQTLIRLGIDPKRSENLAKMSLKIFWTHVLKDLKHEKDVKKVVSRLGKKYELVVASDEFRKNLNAKLNKILGDWKNYFKFLITPDIVKEMKPSKKYYEKVLKKLRLGRNEVIVVGNSWENDLKPAKEMGIKTVLINDKIEGEPVHWIKNMKELEKIV